MPAAAAIGGGALSAVGAYQDRLAGRKASDMAQYRPVSVDFGDLGGVTPVGSRGKVTGYNTDPGVYGQFINPLQSLSGMVGAVPSAANGTGGIYGLPSFAYPAYAGAYNQLGSQVPNFFTPGGSMGFRGLGAQGLGLAGMAGQDVSGALGGGQNPFGSNFGNFSMLPGAPSFDLNAATQQEFGRLQDFNAPFQTTQTQSALDRLQGLGRLGLTQNGELGDLGSLDLSQRLASNDMLGQARQNALQQFQAQQAAYGQNAGLDLQRQMGGAGLQLQIPGILSGLQTSAVGRYGDLSTLAQNADLFGFNRLQGQNNLATQNALSRFQLAGNALGLGQGNVQNILQTGLAGLGGLGTISDTLNNYLKTSIGASGTQASAGADAGRNLLAGYLSSGDIRAQVGGGLMQGGGMFGKIGNPNSDRRLKTDIQKVIKWNGIQFYRFKWKATGKPDFGVMADEVRHLGVVGRDSRGYETVNYGRLYGTA